MLLNKSAMLMLLAGVLGSHAAWVLQPLPTTATAEALKFQPALDFDADGCFQSVAVGADGTVNEGVDSHGIGLRARAGDRRRSVPGEPGGLPQPPPNNGINKALSRCRSHIDNSQTYVRERCNHGWCAYMYGYYFEADINAWDGGHRHDWEHIIVWTLHGEVFFVSWSSHGGWTTGYKTNLRFDGTHVKIVYHQGGPMNHSFREASPEDDKIENPTGNWFRAPLVSLESMTCDFNRKLLNGDWGSAHPDLQRDRFANQLNEAMPADARNNEGFNAYEE